MEKYRLKHKRMLSKPRRTETDYVEASSPYDLYRCKVPELKAIARGYKLKVGGKKADLIRRILDHFGHDKYAVVIQRVFRGHLVRQLFRLLDNKAVAACNNSSDFFSLDPLSDLPVQTLICYTDSSGFRYGFSLLSIFQSIQNRCKMKNPYNREYFPEKVIQRIIQCYHILRIVSPHNLYYESVDGNKTQFDIRGEEVARACYRMLSDNANIPPPNTNGESLYLTMLARFAQIQQKPVRLRILELFMEIDRLGNYTNPDWFAMLSRAEYVQLYRTLYNIWHFRSRLPSLVRLRICILGDPFSRTRIENTVYSLEALTLERMREACLQVFEYMVFGGVDEEHRLLGTFHALSALTVVSRNARESIPWLYESI